MSDICDKMGAINFYHRNQVTKIHSTNNEISLLPVFADKNIKAQRVVSHQGNRDKQKINRRQNNLILTENELSQINQLKSNFKNRLSFQR